MVRITGVDLPKQKRIEIALTYIYGIGLSRSQEILSQLQIDPNIRCKGMISYVTIKLDWKYLWT